MRLNKKILALFHLVDDPDQEVFETVAHQLLNYGTKIIPNLEQLWETTDDEDVQYRIELLIHRALFTELQAEFLAWAKEENPSLLKGGLLVAKYRFPNFSLNSALSMFDQIKRNVWLELNNFLTPLEQINVVNSILYNYYKFKGEEITNRDVDLFSLNYLFDNSRGNAYSIGLLYLAICEALDLPIFAVGLPSQFVLGYFDNLFLGGIDEGTVKTAVQFYIDPVNGMIYTQGDVDLYLKKINAPTDVDHSRPLSSVEVVVRMLEELAQAYDYNKQEEKHKDIQQLASILRDRIKAL